MRNALVVVLLAAWTSTAHPASAPADSKLVIPAAEFFRAQETPPPEPNGPLTILVHKHATARLMAEKGVQGKGVQVRFFRGTVAEILRTGFQPKTDDCWIYPSARNEPFERIAPDKSDVWRLVPRTSNDWLKLGERTLTDQWYWAVVERRIDTNDFVKLATEADAKAYFADGFPLVVKAPQKVSPQEFKRVEALFRAAAQAHQDDIAETQARVQCIRIVTKGGAGQTGEDVAMIAIPCDVAIGE